MPYFIPETVHFTKGSSTLSILLSNLEYATERFCVERVTNTEIRLSSRL